MADREMALQRLESRLVEHLRDQTHVLVDQDLAAVADGDAGRLLATVLQGIQTEVGELGDVLSGGPDSEDTTGILGSSVLWVEIVGQKPISARHSRSLRDRWGRADHPRGQPRAGFEDRGSGEVGEVGEQQRLGQADPLELRQVQTFVGAVRPSVRILHAGHQDRGVGEGLARTRR